MSHGWILDANVFIRAQDDGCFDELVEAAARVGAIVPVAVRDEVGGAGGRKSRAEFHRGARAIDDSAIEVMDIELGTLAEKVYAKLRAANTGSGNEGECACIALAVGTSDVFVTGEAKATFVAVAELEGRVRSIPSFLIDLVERGVLEKAVARAMVDGSLAAVEPSWWRARLGE